MLRNSDAEIKRGEERLITIKKNISHFRFLKTALQSRFPLKIMIPGFSGRAILPVRTDGILSVVTSSIRGLSGRQRAQAPGYGSPVLRP
jgi:hypothetical protein